VKRIILKVTVAQKVMTDYSMRSPFERKHFGEDLTLKEGRDG